MKKLCFHGGMGFVKVASLAHFPPGSLTEVTADGTVIALCNVDGEIRAVSGLCPHSNGPLGFGALHGGNLVCPWHAWEFDTSTGCHDFHPATRLQVYPVKIEGDAILVNPRA
jgi:nitrite reductase/ring-hydroxylating ferredoxin subunit